VEAPIAVGYALYLIMLKDPGNDPGPTKESGSPQNLLDPPFGHAPTIKYPFIN